MGKVRFHVSISSVPSFNSSIWCISYKPILLWNVAMVGYNFSWKCNFYLHNQCTEIMWRKFLENRVHAIFYMWHEWKKTCACPCTNFKNFLVKISDSLGLQWSFLNLLNLKSFEMHAFRHLNHMRKSVSKIHTELLCPLSLCTWMTWHLQLISLHLLSYIFLKASFILLVLSIC